ncbi:hypothetical protein [Xenorhabdus entomophaga]|uniref:hypothetical protein n=1 Tax=Xenorhabdus entomophaga TaxID=3136257 RepID=UPI0030F3EFE0
MKYFIFFIVSLFSMASFSKQDELDFNAWEKTGKWGVFYKKPESYFDPLKIKKYKENYFLAFGYVIKELGEQNINNNFCLIGYKFNKERDREEFERVVIYWKTNNRLINWEVPDGEHYEQYKSIIFSKPFINMNVSVVPYKEAEGAQALWAKEGVMQLIDDCELHGQKITIKPSEIPSGIE